MKAKRDYNLVLNGKYNLKAIMQRAWVYVRNYGYSLKAALKMSWVDAQLKMEEFRNEQTPVSFPKKNLSLSDFYFNPCGNLAMGYVTK